MDDTRKTTLEGKLTLGILAVFVIIPFSIMILTTILRGVYQPFIDDYLARNSTLGVGQGTGSSLPDPVQAVVLSPSTEEGNYGGTTEKIIWDLANFRLTGKLRAGSPKAVNIIIILNEIYLPVGTYSGGQPAFQKRLEVLIIDASSNAILGSKTFLGGNPPTSKTGSSPGYGSSPKGKAMRWVNAFLGSR